MYKSLFYLNLEKDKEKLEMYRDGISSGKIMNFDQTTLTRLRKLYYGFYSGLIYMYYESTNFNNIGNKVELLTYAMEDKEYQIVHGDIDSTRNIPFSMYGVEHLDFNTWLEVKEGQKVWVYDFFSMLKIEKNVYYKLENPKVNKVIPKSVIMSHPGRERDDYCTYHNGFDFMLIDIIPNIEKKMETHPFKEILSPEIIRFKKEINFEDMVLEFSTKMKKKFH